MISTNTPKEQVPDARQTHISTSILIVIFVVMAMFVFTLHAQPAKGANKFLGNITTRGQVRDDYGKYWNQITGENESKWGSVEGTRDRMSWGGTDRIAEYAREAGIPWKFHCLVWGSQYPRWMDGLSQSEQLEEITEWLDEAAERYPDVQMIDVINEAHPSHRPPPFKNALGGDGSTGFDWMIKIFEMARERWPDAVLIYNDYNTIEYGNEVNWQVKMANAMKEADAPMDAIGVQAHAAQGMSAATVKSNIDKLAATGYPIIVSEYDIPQGDDNRQKSIMEDQFTMFWNHPKVVGITYWGYVVGSTWINGSGLMNSNGTERPALTWLVDFVENNPDPSNDFPDLIPMAVPVTAPDNKLVIAPPGYSDIKKGRMEIFDLKGRIIMNRSVTGLSGLLPSLISSQGACVIRRDGRCEGIYKRIR
jgi:endo-1,4-beta-xylanase